MGKGGLVEGDLRRAIGGVYSRKVEGSDSRGGGVGRGWGDSDWLVVQTRLFGIQKTARNNENTLQTL